MMNIINMYFVFFPASHYVSHVPFYIFVIFDSKTMSARCAIQV